MDETYTPVGLYIEYWFEELLCDGRWMERGEAGNRLPEAKAELARIRKARPGVTFRVRIVEKYVTHTFLT